MVIYLNVISNIKIDLMWIDCLKVVYSNCLYFLDVVVNEGVSEWFLEFERFRRFWEGIRS